ncbi:MAG: DUF4097 domain-containing protein [Oscillospiraceae bacterium]|nr:DUF4097 domain-containing protein [Oscillospiraceae bacterium]
MKVWAIIFSCLFLVSLAGLIVSVAITGASVMEAIRSGDFYIGWGNQAWDGYDISKIFDEAYTNVEIGVLAARTEIVASPDGVTRVNYSGNNNYRNVEFIAEISGNTLVVREKGSFLSGGWNWNWWNWGVSIGQTTLEIQLPEAVYNKIDIELTSGSVKGELPEVDNLHVNITSGSVVLDYRHVNTANHLRSHSTSGNITINGFSPETYDVYLTSGNQRISGLSGSGNIRLTSGTANIGFDEWNGELNIKITSGSANITVPRGSGVNDMNFSRTSGSFKWSLDNDTGSMSRSASGVSFGGENRQRVNVDLTSGSASISN